MCTLAGPVPRITKFALWAPRHQGTPATPANVTRQAATPECNLRRAVRWAASGGGAEQQWSATEPLHRVSQALWRCGAAGLGLGCPQLLCAASAMPVGQSVSRQPVARAGGWIPCGHAKHTIHGDVPVRRGREGSGSRQKLKFEISI